jgi:hypothetical protein
LPNLIPAVDSFPTERPSVAPVVDYEPPAFGGPPELPPETTVRPRRHTPLYSVPRTPAEDHHARAAAAFADAALRRVLEVVDRRRPPAQVRPLLAGGLVESLLPRLSRHSLAQDRNARRSTAQLRRVRAQPIGNDGTAAEVAASYTRGDRVHAIACRVEQLPGARWQMVALHLG